MDMTFHCNQCGQSIVIDGAAAGQLVDCPKCGKPLEVPYKAETLNGVARASLRVATLTVPQPAAAPPSKKLTELNEVARRGALLWRRIIAVAAAVAVLATVAVALKYWQTGRQPTASESGVASDFRQQGEKIKALDDFRQQDEKIKALEQRVADLEKAVGQLRGSLAGVAGMASHAERAVRRTPVPPGSSQSWNGPP